MGISLVLLLIPPSIIEQQDSWSEFLAAWALFKQILTSESVFADYLNFVSAFGLKINQVDDDSRVCNGFARELAYAHDDSWSRPVAYR